MFTQLFATDYGLMAVLATVIGLLLPLGFHLFIRRKIRESELALPAAASAPPGFVAARSVDPPLDD